MNEDFAFMSSEASDIGEWGPPDIWQMAQGRRYRLCADQACNAFVLIQIKSSSRRWCMAQPVARWMPLIAILFAGYEP